MSCVPISPNHAESSLRIMESYLHKQQLTDVTLIAADNIESNEMFKDQRMSQELVMEALKYHLLPERRPLLQTGRTKPRKATLGTLLAIGGNDDNEGNLLYPK
ncbi:Kelch-like protein 5 [Temnothorax longispinosus]|uniref:Kelch-like protein 5 n=1 Tax=Temnothorax longispinosus TaxID=300112 RepID=A0A4S2K934_9HYME|nr:Kelch-like protein 5 [Temnothorax longispinosus]